MSTAVGDPVQLWQPPAGMGKPLASAWRTFYRHAYTTYGITPVEYRALYLAQLGRCYVCRTAKGVHPDDPKGGGTRRLGVDHSHLIGYGKKLAVRALVCSGGDRTCNRIIGWFRDDPQAFERAIELLREFPAQAAFKALADGLDDEQIKGMLT